jgi:phosphoribosylpyrophosphate synthetase
VTDKIKENNNIKNIYITNTCPRSAYPISLGIAKEIDISQLISETILRIVNHDSVSELLEK